MIANENEKKILELLKSGATLEEMKAATNLNNYQLSLKLSNLKNRGYQLKKGYHTDKTTFFLSSRDELGNRNYLFRENEDESRFRFLLISDSHLCHVNDDLESLHAVYQYAASQKIHQVFHLGDLIEGIVSHRDSNNRFSDVSDQLSYVIKKYPRIDYISTNIILGNHDRYSLQEEYIDISVELSRKRADFNFLGNTVSFIRFQENQIMLEHPSRCQEPSKLDEESIVKGAKANIVPQIIFRGHLHESTVHYYDEILVVHVPCLYQAGVRKSIGAWEASLSGNQLILSPLAIVGDQVISTTDLYYSLSNVSIVAPEERQQELKKEKRLSQIEKFNNRYGKSNH